MIPPSAGSSEVADDATRAGDSLGVAACLVAFAVFAGVYVPTAGRGFIADDFEWALRNRVRSPGDIGEIFTRDNGFYRPIVALTFAANEYVSGPAPRLYGLTNVLLAALCGLSIFRLARAMSLPAGAAVLSAAVWILNFHGINMAVLWLSGRTALLLTLGATAAARALLSGQPVLACLWFAVALFSNEEAITLPLVGAGLWYLLGRQRARSVRSGVTWIVGTAIVLGTYLVTRASTGAMTPADAPPYYRFTFAPAAVLRNATEYADRTATLAVAVAVVAALLLRLPGRPLARETRRILIASGAWIVGSFLLTVFLPIRSSLYVCLPSVGAAIACAALVSAMWRRAELTRRRRALLAAVLLPVALFPAYWARTSRWVSIAEVSRQTLSDLQQSTADLPDNAVVVLHDDRARRANLSSAFGTLINDAFYFSSERHLSLWIEPAVTYADVAGLRAPDPRTIAREFWLRDGRLVHSLR